MCPCDCHPHDLKREHPLTGCCVCCLSQEMLASYDPAAKEFRTPARDGNRGGRDPRVESSNVMTGVRFAQHRYDIRRLVGTTIRLAQGPCKGDEVVVMRTDDEHPGEIEVMWRREPTQWLPGMVVKAGEWSNFKPDVRVSGPLWIPVFWTVDVEQLQRELREAKAGAGRRDGGGRG